MLASIENSKENFNTKEFEKNQANTKTNGNAQHTKIDKMNPVARKHSASSTAQQVNEPSAR